MNTLDTMDRKGDSHDLPTVMVGLQGHVVSSSLGKSVRPIPVYSYTEKIGAISRKLEEKYAGYGQVTRKPSAKILYSQILQISTYYDKKGKLTVIKNKLAIAAAQLLPEDKAYFNSLPVCREDKLKAVGLTVMSTAQSTAVRYSYGQKPPEEKPNGRAALRRLRQIQARQLSKVSQ